MSLDGRMAHETKLNGSELNDSAEHELHLVNDHDGSLIYTAWIAVGLVTEITVHRMQANYSMNHGRGEWPPTARLMATGTLASHMLYHTYHPTGNTATCWQTVNFWQSSIVDIYLIFGPFSFFFLIFLKKNYFFFKKIIFFHLFFFPNFFSQKKIAFLSSFFFIKFFFKKNYSFSSFFFREKLFSQRHHGQFQDGHYSQSWERNKTRTHLLLGLGLDGKEWPGVSYQWIYIDRM